MLVINKKIILIIVVIVVVVLAAVWWIQVDPTVRTDQNETDNELITEEESGNQPDYADNPAVREVKFLVAQKAGIGEDGISVVSVAYKEWPNSCLGLERPGEFCAQVITPGYEVTVNVVGQEFTYRTNLDGSVVRLADSLKKG